jgi:hypothetical protein
MRICIAALLTSGLLLTTAAAQNASRAKAPKDEDPFSNENAPAERREGVERTRSSVLDTPTEAEEQLGAGGAADPAAPGLGAAGPAITEDTPARELASPADESSAESARAEFDRIRRQAGASSQAEPTPDRWRMVYHQGVWWYWTPANTWLMWSNGRWGNYRGYDPYAGRPYTSAYRGPASAGGMRSGGGAIENRTGTRPGGSRNEAGGTITGNNQRPDPRSSARMPAGSRTEAPTDTPAGSDADPRRSGLGPGGQLNTHDASGLESQAPRITPPARTDRGADASRATGGQPALGPAGGGPAGGGTVDGSSVGGTGAGSGGSGVGSSGSGSGSGGSGK